MSYFEDNESSLIYGKIPTSKELSIKAKIKEKDNKILSKIPNKLPYGTKAKVTFKNWKGDNITKIAWVGKYCVKTYYVVVNLHESATNKNKMGWLKLKVYLNDIIKIEPVDINTPTTI